MSLASREPPASLKALSLTMILAGLVVFTWAATRLLTFPVPWPDEGLFADPAIALANGRGFGTRALTGLLPGIDTYTYWIPPTYLLLVAGLFKIAAPTLAVMRGLSLALGVLVAVEAAFIMRAAGARVWTIATAMALLSSDALFIRGSHIGRMDILTLALILAALWQCIALDQPINSSSPSPGSRGVRMLASGRMFALGCTAGTAMTCHPLGAIAVLLVVVQLFWLRPGAERAGAQQLAWTATGLILPLGLWGCYIALDPGSFVSQLGAQLARKTARAAALPVAALDAPEYGVNRLLMLGAWAFGVSGLWIAAHGSSHWRRILVCQAAALAAAIAGRETWYLLLPAPLTAVGIAVLIEHASARRIWRGGTLVVATVTIAVAVETANLVWLARILMSRAAASPVTWNVEEWCQKIRAQLPGGGTVLLAAVPDPYFCLAGTRGLREVLPANVPYDQDSHERFLAGLNFALINRSRPSAAMRGFIEANGRLVGTAPSLAGTSALEIWSLEREDRPRGDAAASR